MRIAIELAGILVLFVILQSIISCTLRPLSDESFLNPGWKEHLYPYNQPTTP